MIETSLDQTRSEQNSNQDILQEPVFHDKYDVKTDTGGSVGINLLHFYYGELWVSAMNRLNHKIDGHLFDIRYEGVFYGVYRKLKSNKSTERFHLRLVKKE